MAAQGTPGQTPGYMRRLLLEPLVRLGRDIVRSNDVPVPYAAMARIGLGVGLGFAVFAATGYATQGVAAALYANLLGFNDHRGPLGERLAVLITAAAMIAAGAFLGTLALEGPHREAVTIGAVFALSLVAGLVHSWLPGVEMIPRNTVVAFVVCAYLPIANGVSALSAAIGGILMITVAALDGLLRPEAATPSLFDLRRELTRPDLRFALSYAAAACLGLIFADTMGISRGYWVTLTTVLVMQPGSDASVSKAVQRFVGTVGGVAAAFLLTMATRGPHAAVVLAVIVVLPFLWPAAYARNFTLGVAILSTWILLLINIALPPSQTGQVFEARFYDTAIGCAFAILGTLVAAPSAFAAAWRGQSQV